MRKNGRNFNCQTCGKEFYRNLAQIKRNECKFCSLHCRKFTDDVIRKMSETRKGVNTWTKGRKLSEETKRKINPLGRKHTEETKRKISLSHKGEKSYLWKGGITSLFLQIRNSFEYRQWRSDVFTRDNFVCQECFKRGGGLEVHHIKSFSKIMKEYQIKTFKESLMCQELWNINNGITLCKECHKNTDTYLNKKLI